jgi:hypothetical protein
MATTKYWDRVQIADHVKRAKKRLGPGWDLLGPEIQRAIVHQDVLSTLCAQSMDVPVAAIRELVSGVDELLGRN